MIYENRLDRERQAAATEAVQQYVARLPIIGESLLVTETPESGRLCYDICFHVWGMFIGIGEIKCRDLTLEYIRKNGWLFERERIVELWKHRKPVMLVCAAKDGIAFTTRSEMEDNADKITRAPDGWMKDDHGRKDANKTGIIIPWELMTEIPI